MLGAAGVYFLAAGVSMPAALAEQSVRSAGAVSSPGCAAPPPDVPVQDAQPRRLLLQVPELHHGGSESCH